MARPASREALVAIPESARAHLPGEGRAQIYGDPANYPARLRELAGAADALTRTFAARYTLGGAAAAAPLGATVTLALPQDAASNLAVPLGAITDPGSGPGVWIIAPDLRVQWRPVRVMAWQDEQAVIAPGAVRPGERIVALGAQLLRAGQRVRLASVTR